MPRPPAPPAGTDTTAQGTAPETGQRAADRDRRPERSRNGRRAAAGGGSSTGGGGETGTRARTGESGAGARPGESGAGSRAGGDSGTRARTGDESPPDAYGGAPAVAETETLPDPNGAAADPSAAADSGGGDGTTTADAGSSADAPADADAAAERPVAGATAPAESVAPSTVVVAPAPETRPTTGALPDAPAAPSADAAAGPRAHVLLPGTPSVSIGPPAPAPGAFVTVGLAYTTAAALMSNAPYPAGTAPGATARSAAAAGAGADKSARSHRTAVVHKPHAPLTPPNGNVHAASAATSSGGAAQDIWCALVACLAIVAAYELRRYRIRLGMPRPAGFTLLGERPG